LGTVAGATIVEATAAAFGFPLVSNRVWIVRAGQLSRAATEAYRLLVTLVLYLDARCKDSRVTEPRAFGASASKDPPTPTVDVVVGGAANCKGVRPLVGVDAFILDNFVCYLCSVLHETRKEQKQLVKKLHSFQIQNKPNF